jgi:hypothetical protein
MRRLLAQLENLQLDPYADICNLLEGRIAAMARGAEERPSPFEPYVANLDEDGPGSFQTYTFDDHPLSIVRLLDSQLPVELEEALPLPEMGFNLDLGINSLFQSEDDDEDDERPRTAAVEGKSLTFLGPAARGLDRPHEMGWLDQMFDDSPAAREGPPEPVPAGRIIPDEEA